MGIAAVAFVTGARPAGIGLGWGAEWLTMLVGAALFAVLVAWFARTARLSHS